MSILSPAALLLLLLTTTHASLAHALLGRTWRQLPIFWVAAAAGCLIATVLGWRFPLNLPTPAGVPMLEASLLAWLVLIVVSRLRL
ncbi:MAG: hypothetical protein D6823_01975 [Chloroflexi bacterium]|jgi:hypothetical protein|nr:MAG: hypothetical protein D6823_01975 [Chloroflexota bacterium]